ncbi:MAG: hypothetical protein ACRDGV_00095 [Candidatus Limnocylindria bacterium]
MSINPTRAERLDRAVDAILGGQPLSTAAATVASDAALRPLVEAAALLRSALTPFPASERFEARLGARLAAARGTRALRQPARLIIAGAAVSSAAVGVGVTAYAVWRTTRRGHWLHR